MKVRHKWIGLAVMAASCSMAFAQTLNPQLGNIEAPYAPLQSPVTAAKVTWGPGATAYGPAGTPLVLTGANFGASGTVQFVGYKNGSADPGYTTQATVTMWTSNMLFLTVPSGAVSGLVTVTREGVTSNGLPFVVTPGVYAGSCPAGPTSTQLQITTSSLNDGKVGQAYNITLGASGGTPGPSGYTWSVASGSLPAGLTLSSGGVLSGTPTAATGTNPTAISFLVKDNGTPQQTDQAEIAVTIQPQALTPSSGAIYSYGISYDAAGNIIQLADATNANGPGIMGNWTYSYDSLNRLATSNATWPDNTPQSMCWSYDGFGNRLQQKSGNSAFSGGGGSSCSTTGTLLGTSLSSFNTGNQITSTNARGWQPGYDAAGNLLSDRANSYLYDAEGRVCAVQGSALPGINSLTGYIYDADGTRVAKGTIPNATIGSISCDPSTWTGFQFTENYVNGPGGEELTMLDGNNNWQRTNVYVGSKLVGTYDLVQNQPALHFHLEDALGTRRMQISGMYTCLGQPETDFQSLPYGDGLATFPDPLACSFADDATPLHFTGKERDTESGNDYFGARYYSSAMGRFMSPDWSAKEEPVPYAKLDDPQTLNLYAYVGNNPMDRVDADGHAGCKDTPELCKAVRDAVSAGQSIVNGWMNYLSSKISSNSSNSTNSQTPTANSGHAAGGFNKQTYANSVESHAGDKSTGYCARACRKGMEAGGLNTAGRPGDAKNYGPFLLKNGFGVVPSTGYFGHEQSGDTAVFQPVPGHSQSGHIETWTGSHWSSDFKQNHFSPYRGFDASDLDFKIYRHE